MTEQAKAFCDASGLTMVATFVPFSQSRNKGEKHPSLNWQITLKKGKMELTTDYMQGCAHLPNYSHQFGNNGVYRDAVARACETGKSGLRPDQKNAYDAAGGERSYSATPVPPPSLTDVLHCLVSDADALNHPTFESWASDLGYDTDSRSAEKIYRACLEIALTLRQMIDLEAAQVAFQDY